MAAPQSIRVTDEDEIEAVPFEYATHVFVGAKDSSLHGVFHMVYAEHGAAFESVCVANGRYMFIYYKTTQTMRYVDMTLPIMLSSIYNNFPIDYAVPGSLTTLIQAASSKWGLRENKEQVHTPLSICNLVKDKVSGAHHIHYTAEEVWRTLTTEEREQARLAFYLPAEVSTTMMAGCLIWLAALTPLEFIIVYYTGMFFAKDVKAFAAIAKAVSVRAKSIQNQTFMDLRKLFEADVLVNRILGDPVWHDEFKNRSRPNLARVTPQFVYREVAKALAQGGLLAEKPRALEWDEFWATRWQWVASGSVHTQYREQEKYIIRERELRNKLITVAQIDKMDLNQLLKKKPQIHAWASVKYEWGKQRAIYGCDLTSYIISQFAFYNCEDTLPAQFPVGKKAKPQYVSQKVGAVLEDRTQFCFDFEDFNSQHSFENMYAAIMAWKDTVGSTLTTEQKLAVDWTAKSLYDTVIHDNQGLKTTYSASGTLMSGWRLTTFINSLLNYAYMRYMLGKYRDEVYSVHNGDDVLLGISSLHQVQTMMRRASSANIRAQRSKCALSAICEFLRVDHMRGSTGQYLTRNIATLVHGRIESLAPATPKAFIEAAEMRLVEFEVRSDFNSSLASRLRDVYYKRTALLTGSAVEDLYLMKATHAALGGLDTSEEALTTHTVREEIVHEEEYHKLDDVKLPAIGQYARVLKGKLRVEIPIEKIEKRIYKNTLGMVKPTRKVVKVDPVTDIESSRVKSCLYKCFKDVTNTADFGKAQLAGCAIELLNSSDHYAVLASQVRHANDPMSYLALVT